MTTFPLESFLDDLKFLINTDSGSADIEGNLQVASFFKERFEKAGLETDDPEFNRAVAKAMTEIEVTGATGVMTWSADGECKKQAKAVVISDGAYVDYADYKAQ